MSGVALEIKTKCQSCGNQIALNALVPKVRCFTCGKESEFGPDVWQGLLGDNLKETRTFDENEGRNSTIMTGTGTFQMMYGKQIPRDPVTKKSFDMKAVEKMAAQAAGKDFMWAVDGRQFAVRPVPPEYRDFLPGATLLLCEDSHLWPAAGDGEPAAASPTAAAPIAFHCPHCGAALNADGTQRNMKCEFCGNSSVLPDDFWQKLHPTSQVARWYVWLDDAAAPCDWDDDVFSLAVDNAGRIFLLISTADGDGSALVRLGADLTAEWTASLDLPTDESARFPRMTLNPDGNLLVWHGSKNALRIHSSKDGSRLALVGGKDGKQPSDPAQPFSLKDCQALACDADGTILTVYSVNGDEGYYCEIRRFDQDGNRRPTWPEGAKQAKKGLFARILGAAHESETEPSLVDGLGDRPTRMEEGGDIGFAFGADGHFYVWQSSYVARYDRDGKKIYAIKTPEEGQPKALCTDKNGCAFAIADGAILKISPDGKSVRTFVANRDKGGAMGEEDLIGVDDGTIYVAGSGGKFRKFDCEGKALFVSAASAKNDDSHARERRKADAD